MKTIELVKDVATFAVSTGTMLIVGNAVDRMTPLGTGIVKRTLIKLGSIGLALTVSDKTSDHFADVLDRAEAAVIEMLTKIDEEEEE